MGRPWPPIHLPSSNDDYERRSLKFSAPYLPPSPNLGLHPSLLRQHALLQGIIYLSTFHELSIIQTCPQEHVRGWRVKMLEKENGNLYFFFGMLLVASLLQGRQSRCRTRINPGLANRLFLFLFLFCFCSKCCWESSRYNFFPSETFLGGKWICIETFLGGKHFFSENFLDGKLLLPRTYLMAKFYHQVFSRCQWGDYA